MAHFRSGEYVPPCVAACPVHVNIPRYVLAISDGRFADALTIIQERLPFPSVCSQICTRPCEEACNANRLLDKGPIAIRALKRFVADWSANGASVHPVENTTGKRVAVIGSGPAGLTASYYLKRIGHAVTVLERLDEPGGMLRFGIPDYRLNKKSLHREIERVRQIGVEIRTGYEVESVSRLLDAGYDAVFVAIGAHRSRKMGIEGEDTPRVLDGLSFMKQLNYGKRFSLGKKVIVIGGGNTALDSARSALRLGSDVTVLYRRSREDMPASADEVNEAEAEGLTFQFLTAPVRMEAFGDRIRVECVRTALHSVQGEGRPSPVPVPGTEFTVEADHVISGLGQVLEVEAGFDVFCTEEGLIQVDKETLSTNRLGVFAGGDAVTGPASFIEAVAAGWQAAASIDRYLGGEGRLEFQTPTEDERVLQTKQQGFPVGKRVSMPSLDAQDRRTGFSQIELGLTQEQAVEEAGRCMRCDLPIQVDPQQCTGCMTCVMRCSLRFDKSFSPRAAKIRIVPYADERINDIAFEPTCDGCGICARYCPHGALFRGERVAGQAKS